jgi:hypothetical protein
MFQPPSGIDAVFEPGTTSPAHRRRSSNSGSRGSRRSASISGSRGSAVLTRKASARLLGKNGWYSGCGRYRTHFASMTFTLHLHPCVVFRVVNANASLLLSVSAVGLKVRVEILFKKPNVLDVYVWSAMQSIFGDRFIAVWTFPFTVFMYNYSNLCPSL